MRVRGCVSRVHCEVLRIQCIETFRESAVRVWVCDGTTDVVCESHLLSRRFVCIPRDWSIMSAISSTPPFATLLRCAMLVEK